ncbi:MAG: DEAD/DEAH box helicase [Flavobacterium sp.]|uniref:DEAD/DEAH box helicase n=1 Tax=Flavobacterium sp. TaxID=239 RepID=UPI001206B413|nr:DEAD/DEAH box helicase [Flavobacterium sp.]RZJ63191.1 MAG: DEAD/DEAH box helicase [Flavobacterium sp.]
MNLKKINPSLQKSLVENDLLEPVELLAETFSAIKSGGDCYIVAPSGSGKTTMLVINTIQKLSKAEGESTRALLIVESKEKMLEMVDLFQVYGKYTDLRVHGTNDKTDIDNDKNLISLGIDVLIGTPNKINALFSGAGFNMNTVRLFIVDDADKVFANRSETIVMRLAQSIKSTQYIFTVTDETEKTESVADKVMDEPTWFDFYPNDDEDDD